MSQRIVALVISIAVGIFVFLIAFSFSFLDASSASFPFLFKAALAGMVSAMILVPVWIAGPWILKAVRAFAKKEPEIGRLWVTRAIAAGLTYTFFFGGSALLLGWRYYATAIMFVYIGLAPSFLAGYTYLWIYELIKGKRDRGLQHGAGI